MKPHARTGEPTSFRDPPLLEQSRALTLYLDSLFRDVPETPALEDTPVVPPLLPVAEMPRGEEVAPVEIAEHPEPPEPGAAFEKTPFTCLRIGMGDLQLAVPMSSLFGIRRLPDKPIRLPGSPPWVLGMLGGGDEKVQVVDLAALLGSSGDVDATPEAPRHAVIVADGRWAIACDAAGRSLRVDPALVRWSGGHARLPWLAGIVAGELCTLLDPKGLAAWLDRAGAEPK